MNKLLFYILLILCNTNVHAQNIVLDSLKNALENHTKQDTLRVNLLNETIKHSEGENKDSLLQESENLSNKLNYKNGQIIILLFKGSDEMRKGNYPKAIMFYNKSLNLSKSINNKVGESTCLSLISIAYYYQSNYLEALNYSQKSLRVDLEINDSVGITYNYNNIGNVYADLGKYDSAIYYYSKSISVDLSLNNNIGVARVYNNIGTIYRDQSNYPLALDNFFKGLKLYEGNEEALKKSDILSNISSIYVIQNKLDKALEIIKRDNDLKKDNNDKNAEVGRLSLIGNIYSKQLKHKEALKIFNQALKINREINNRSQIATSLNNIAKIKFDIKDTKSALQFYNEALHISIDIGNQRLSCVSYLGIANVFLNENKHSKALEHALKGHKIATDLYLLDNQKEAANLLYKIYKHFNNYEKALENHEQLKILNDSLFNQENIEKITQLEYEYKYQAQLASANEREETLTKKIDTTNQSLEKSQQNTLVGIIAFLLIAIAFGTTMFFLRLKEQKDKVKYSEMEQKLLRSQMTPHFIFNSLSVLQGIILNKEEKKSIFYLTKFAKLLRITLENSREKTVQLKEELVAIENYITLQNINIDPPCNYTITVDENIDSSHFKIPPMLIQPFIENVVEHAFGNIKTERELKIHLSFKDNKLVCTIQDNGIGVDAHSKEIKKKSKRSLATTITAERLEILSKDFKFKGSITVEDRIKYNEQGTLVTLIIPYIKS